MSASPSRAAIDPQVIAAASSPAVRAGKPTSKAKPVSKSKPSSTEAAKGRVPTKKPVSASKKSTSSSTQKVTAPKKVVSKPAGDSKLSMEEMVLDAIKNDKENVRGGVSRPAIKKYLAFRFKIIDTPSNVSRLNRTIARGAEKGVFALPKGASGKVKLGKPLPDIKDSKPLIKAVKPASKSTSVKKVPSSKPSAAAKKTAVSKKTTVAKKPTKKVTTSSIKKTATAKTSSGKKISSSTKKVKAAAKKS